jgi:DNA-directed RNA polymerase specialized sigma24 family protein
MGGLDHRTDGELLVATADDPEAFAIFYRRHVRGVLAFFRRRVPSAELALDLTAETFAAALEASPRYKPRPEPARGWLYGIAWSNLHEARHRGRSEDIARCELGMAPIVLGERGIAQIEAVAGASALSPGRFRSRRAPARPRLLERRVSDEDAAALQCSRSVAPAG